MSRVSFEDSTSKSLLNGLRVGDPVAWARVSTIYGPLILGWGKRFGLPRPDCEDLCQSVLISVIRYGEGFKKDKPNYGFRIWLFTVTRREIIKQQTSKQRLPTIDSQTISELVRDEAAQRDDPADPPEVLNELYRRAVKIVKDSCLAENWEIFMLAIAADLDYEEIARRYGTTTGNVRTIRCRYIAKLRGLLELTDDEPPQ